MFLKADRVCAAMDIDRFIASYWMFVHETNSHGVTETRSYEVTPMYGNDIGTAIVDLVQGCLRMKCGVTRTYRRD